MQVRIITVGKLKEKYWREAIKEYVKRLTAFTRIEIVEVAEERLPDQPSTAEIENCKIKEGERIKKHLSPSFFVIPLAIEGKMVSSEDLAKKIDNWTLEGKSQLAFIIGGSYGISQEILKKGDYLLSFSPMTFPHQMMRVILLEQVYRAFKIIRNEPYHK